MGRLNVESRRLDRLLILLLEDLRLGDLRVGQLALVLARPVETAALDHVLARDVGAIGRNDADGWPPPRADRQLVGALLQGLLLDLRLRLGSYAAFFSWRVLLFYKDRFARHLFTS